MRKVCEVLSRKLTEAVEGTIPVNPVFTESQVKYPYINYICTDSSPVYTKDGLQGFVGEFEIHIYTVSFDQGLLPIDRIIHHLSGYRDDTIKDCRIASISSSSDVAYCQILILKIDYVQ